MQSIFKQTNKHTHTKKALRVRSNFFLHSTEDCCHLQMLSLLCNFKHNKIMIWDFVTKAALDRSVMDIKW